MENKGHKPTDNNQQPKKAEKEEQQTLFSQSQVLRLLKARKKMQDELERRRKLNE